MRKLRLASMSFRWLWMVAVLALLMSTVVFTVESVSAVAPLILIVDDDDKATIDSRGKIKCNSPLDADHDNIQDAITEAAGHDGSTVYVCPGTYKEHVVVDVAGLTLLGISARGNKQPVVDGEDLETGPVIDITADGVTVENFTVIDAGGDSAFNPGIATKADGSIIRHNTISGNRCGIILWEGASAPTHGATNAVVEHNTIFDNSRDGIRVQDDSHDNDILDNNTHDNKDFGIGVKEDAHDNNILGNNVHNNDKNGIFLATTTGGGGSENVYDLNHVHNNGFSGIKDDGTNTDGGGNNVHNNGVDP